MLRPNVSKFIPFCLYSIFYCALPQNHYCSVQHFKRLHSEITRMGSKAEEKAKKHGLYVKTAPQETDGIDDRKPFPSDSTSTTTRDDPRDGKSSQSQTTIKVLLLFNMMSAFLNGINDCDETFNYWEPLHYLLFGEGFQTWEYSPEYGLRSWFYIFIHSIPSIPVSLDRNNRVLMEF